MPITLELKGLGHVPSKKNKHFCAKDGKRVLLDLKTKHWMRRAANSIAFQLCSVFPTTAAVTLTAPALRSLIALLPHDDNWSVIPELSVRAVRVPKGQEGALITIEEI